MTKNILKRLHVHAGDRDSEISERSALFTELESGKCCFTSGSNIIEPSSSVKHRVSIEPSSFLILTVCPSR